MAAEQGLPADQHNLALMYVNGQGVERDSEQAVEWFTKAAEQNYLDATVALATSYWDGSGVAKNLGTAYALLWIAVLQDHANAKEGERILVKQITPAQRKQAQKLAKAWHPSLPLPTM